VQKGYLTVVILLFCPSSRTGAYKAEAKKGKLIASGVTRGRKPPFCLGSAKNRGHILPLFATVTPP